MKLADFADRLDEQLRVDAFADIDPSANGLQVGDVDAEVTHAAFAVDGALATIEAAADAGADVLCVHHGIIWEGLDRVTGRAFDRIAALIEAEIGLYAVHLPLDAHPDLGNAAGVAGVLDLDGVEAFGGLGSETIGLSGRLADGPVDVDTLAERLAAGLEPEAPPVRTLAFGGGQIGRVGILTGSGADWVEEAAEEGLDALVTGEGKQSLYHRAREAGLHVVLGGHYATETFGVRSLASLAEEWGLETTFVEHPTGF